MKEKILNKEEQPNQAINELNGKNQINVEIMHKKNTN